MSLHPIRRVERSERAPSLSTSHFVEVNAIGDDITLNLVGVEKWKIIPMTHLSFSLLCLLPPLSLLPSLYKLLDLQPTKWTSPQQSACHGWSWLLHFSLKAHVHLLFNHGKLELPSATVLFFRNNNILSQVDLGMTKKLPRQQKSCHKKNLTKSLA